MTHQLAQADPMLATLTTRRYRVYGLRLQSAFPLPCPEHDGSDQTDTELVEGSQAFWGQARKEAGIPANQNQWFEYAPLAGGSAYLRWTDLFEFVVSAEGRRIACRTLNGTSFESFQSYLVSQVLSFALVKRGREPLHSTTVVVNGHAVALLGDSGYGKSSLGAAFLQNGHSLLTDDLLAVEVKGSEFMAQPGPPHIKLFPEIARALLGICRTGAPMNPGTPKQVIPLEPQLVAPTASPLKAFYVLRPPASGSTNARITIRSLSPRRACLALIANTFNPVILEPDRLSRQFQWAARLATGVPVKSLSYPRDLSQLPAVVKAIRADLTS